MADKANAKKDNHYLSGKEIRAIAKENRKVTRALEKRKHRRAAESEFVTEMKDKDNILEIEDLHTYFYTDQGVVKAVNGVSFNVPKNATVGIVGESGCGKSVTSMSVMQLIQGPAGQIVSGHIRFNSEDYKRDKKGEPVAVKDADGNVHFETEEKVYDIANMPIHEIYRIRGRQIAMIFQEPMTSLNPVFTIGNQLDEVTFIHVPGATKEMAKKASMEMLELVGIAAPGRVYKSYPHELSGGMRQRVMIAMALACNPRLIIADEPTTALDVTIQAQILDLFRDLRTKINGSILLITHDLGVVAEMADYVVVMYAGRVIEQGTVREIFHDPKHPYTEGLLGTLPKFGQSGRLEMIPGVVPPAGKFPAGCVFAPRCKYATEKCHAQKPGLCDLGSGHKVRCFRYEQEEK
jgi:peptide/nickel transport system ATP-binding protein